MQRSCLQQLYFMHCAALWLMHTVTWPLGAGGGGFGRERGEDGGPQFTPSRAEEVRVYAVTLYLWVTTSCAEEVGFSVVVVLPRLIC